MRRWRSSAIPTTAPPFRPSPTISPKQWSCACCACADAALRACWTTLRSCSPRATPYRPRPGNAYRRTDAHQPLGGEPFRGPKPPPLELPIAVTPLLSLPVIGTSVLGAPSWLRRAMVKRCLSTGFFNFELHGIDLADAQADGYPPALIARQPDLRWPLTQKLAALENTILQAKQAGARFQTLIRSQKRKRPNPFRDRPLRLGTAAEPLDVEFEVNDVAVSYQVLLTFHRKLRRLPTGSLGLQFNQVFPPNHVGLNEPSLEIGVNNPSRLRRLDPRQMSRPGTHPRQL